MFQRVYVYKESYFVSTMFSSDEVDTEVHHLKVFNLLPWQELSTQGDTELVFVFGFGFGSLWLLLTIRVLLVVADNKCFEFWIFASLLTHITQGPYTKCSQLQGLKKCHFPPAKVTKWSSKRGSKSLCWIKLKTSKCQTCQEFLLGQYQIMRCDLKVLQPLVFEDTRIEWYLIFSEVLRYD